MTDRVNGFWVALDRDIRDDDFEAIKSAVLMMKHVSGVTENIAGPDEWIARERLRRELLQKVIALFEAKP